MNILSQRFLGVLLIVLGISAIVIGASIVFLGAGFTLHATEMLYARATGSHLPLDGNPGATVESEMHFYAPFWIAYGIILIATTRDLARYLSRVPALAAVFFAGGAGRAIAFAQSGPPHPAFSILMAIELILPVVFMALWAGARRHAAKDVSPQ